MDGNFEWALLVIVAGGFLFVGAQLKAISRQLAILLELRFPEKLKDPASLH